MEKQRTVSKPVWWTGSVLKTLVTIFLLFDAIMKIIKHPQYVQGTKEFGLPEACVQFLGVYLLIGTLLYLIPRTTLLGILWLTSYLGGAVAITYRAQHDGHPYLFPVVFAVFILVAEFLKNEKVRKALPFVK